MTVHSAWGALRERWLVVLVGVLVGGSLGLLVAVLSPRTHASTASVYVSAHDPAGGAQAAYEGGLLSQQRIKSYAEIALSERVLQPAASSLRPPEQAKELADRVAVSSSADSTMLSITVEAPTAEAAAEATNAVADRFVQVVTELERPDGAGEPVVDTTIVDRGLPEPDAVSPRTGLDIVVGLVFGLLAGIAGALVAGAADPRVRTASSLAAATGARVLGVLPLDAEAEESGDPVVVPAGRAHHEAVRSIRTHLVFAHPESAPRVVAVTSAVPQEGKTTFACALASAVSSTHRVVIVEGDLRRSVLAERLDLSPVGLTDVAGGRIGLDQALQPWGEDVTVLVSGSPSDAPSELLSSSRLGGVLDQLRERFDLVVIDCPPVLPVTDAALLAQRADGVVLLCRRSTGSVADVRQAVDTLTAVEATVLGTVLTMDPSRRPRYGYEEWPTVPRPVPEPVTREVPLALEVVGDRPPAPGGSGPDPAPSGAGS